MDADSGCAAPATAAAAPTNCLRVIPPMHSPGVQIYFVQTLYKIMPTSGSRAQHAPGDIKLLIQTRISFRMQRFPLTQKQSASNRTPREINRNLIFNLIRRREPISRADLARISGLQRSTVSLIVEELIVDRWVLEGSTGKLPRGRHPTFLHLNRQP